MSLNCGFEFLCESKSKRAILLFHGLTGSPYEMKKFGKFLSDNGFDVFCECLPGHGDSVSDIYTVKYEEWLNYVDRRYEEISAKYEEVFVAGLCLGAVLSLAIAEKYQDTLKGVISLSTTLFLDGWRLPWYAFLMPITLNTIFRYYYTYPECEPYGVKNERTRETIKKLLAKSGSTGMDNYPMCAFHELLELSDEIQMGLSDIVTPILIIHAKEDDLTSVKSAYEVYENVSSEDKELVILENSYHMVLYDNEKDFVFKKALKFLNEHSSLAEVTL